MISRASYKLLLGQNSRRRRYYYYYYEQTFVVKCVFSDYVPSCNFVELTAESHYFANCVQTCHSLLYDFPPKDVRTFVFEI